MVAEFPANLPDDLEREIDVAGHAMRVRPMACDVPASFQVDASESLNVAVRYRGAITERAEPMHVNGATVEVGAVSGRVFRITTESANWQELDRALVELESSTELPARKINYDLTRRALMAIAEDFKLA